MIGFCHIPKTGGTSLVQGMRDAGMNVWVPTPPEGVEPWDVTDWQQQPPKGTDVVAGHISVWTRDQFPVEQWITVIRHPVERYLSHLYWINRNTAEGVPWRLAPTNLMTTMLGLQFYGLGGDCDWWKYDRLEVVADWFGVALPEERHKLSGSPEAISPDLATVIRGLNFHDVDAWDAFDAAQKAYYGE